LIRTNQSLRTILNVTDDQVIGKYNVLHDDNLIKQGLMPAVQAVFNDLQTARFNMFWTGTEAGDADLSMARELWIDVSMFPVLDENGKLENVVCQYVDITERKQVEDALQKSVERYQSLLINLEAGVVVHAPDTSILLNNQRASELLGLSDDQMRGKKAIDPSWKFIHENNNPFRLEEYPVTWVAAHKKPIKNLTLGVLRPVTKDIVWLTVNGLPVLDNNGEIVEILISFIEITDRKNVEDELQKLNQVLELRVAQRTQQLEAVNNELQSFVYSVSHDLRAPLRSIMGFSEIISRRYIDNLNEEGLEYFGYVLEASKNMAALIEGLLLFSRLAKSPVEKELINLNEILQLVLQSLNQDIVENNAKIDIPDTLPEIKGDRALLSQIFTNLIQNAIMYHRAGMTPEVTLSVEDSKDNIIVKVSDNGQGIPEEHHKKIFNIFQRLHTNDECPGTGIGLAIVKKAVVALGGSITLESNVDKGSTFSVILPKN